MSSTGIKTIHLSHWRSSFRWAFAVVFVTLLAVFVTNTQGLWVYAATSGSQALSGTVVATPAGITCGDSSQQFGFLDTSGGLLDSINLDNPGDSVDFQVCADGLTLGGPDTVQVVIEHDDSIVELINPVCAGLLSGGFASPSTKRTSDDLASAFICTKPGGVSGSAGAVLRLTARRTGVGAETLVFRTAGAIGTRLYESGVLVPVSGFASLSVQQENPSLTATAPPAFFAPPASTATPVPTSGGGAAPPVLQLEPPTEPANFEATPGLFSIVLAWEVPDETSDRPIDQYLIQNLKTGEIVRLDGDVLTYTFTGLDPNLEYFFTIKASTGLGTGPATGAGPLSPWDLPGPPTSVAANIEADGSSVVVSWSAPESDGGTPVTGYSVVLTPAALAGTVSTLVSEPGENQVLIPNLLSPGDVYSVGVSAITAAGTGPAAGGVSVSRPPEPGPSPTPSSTVVTANATVTATVIPTAGADETVPFEIVVSEDDGNALEAAIEAIAGRDVAIDEVVVTTESTGDGISITIPVDGLTADTELSGSLEVQIGRLFLDVTNGTGTAEIRLADDITVVGAASVSAGENTLDVQIVDPVLRYSPRAVDDGSFAASTISVNDVAVSFEVDLELLLDDVSLITTYSADIGEFETAVGSTFTLTADSELAYFVSVQKSGVTQGSLGDNTVTMSVSSGWLDDMVSQGREVAVTKITDGGEVFTEVAQCERLIDRAACTVTFTGGAGGFSVFAIYGFVNNDPEPRPQPLATPGSRPTPTLAAASPTPIAGPGATATAVSEPPRAPTSTPEVVPTPSEVDLDRDDFADFGDPDGDGGTSVIAIVAIVAVAAVAAGSIVAVFVRRPVVPTMGLVIIAMTAGSITLIAGDSSVAFADEEPDFRQVNVEILPDFDKNDFRYRKVGSGVRVLSEAYRAGTLDERPEFSGLSAAEAIDPSIDVTVRFASPDVVDLKLISQMATVLNHVGDVVEARVPVRFAHQLSYIQGVLEVDRITPPQVSVTSEGAAVHGSPAWNAVGLDGTGIKVGIIDVGFMGWSSISPSELPTPAGVRCYTSVGVFTSILSDCETDTVHGSAVAEAVDDIAPAVEFYISNPASWLDMLAATQWMASQGVQIINHSAGWSWSGPGDGTSVYSASPFASVDSAVASGILWVNAAGNEAEGHWYGTYSDTDSNQWLEIAGVFETQVITSAVAGSELIELRWEDAWPGASTDLDLYLLDDSAAVVLASSLDPQSGDLSEIPYESISAAVSSGYRIAIRHFSGPAPAWIELRMFRGSSLSDAVAAGSIGTPASSANSGMLAVGAAAWSSTSTIESFSSQGPTTDGRIKPDIVGADRGNSVSYGVGGFFGTSQASPHVAGLAALALQRFPIKTPAELATYLKTNAADRGTAGVDNTWGSGFAELTAPTPPTATADSYSVAVGATLSVSSSNGVLSNDSDSDDAITASLVSDVSYGSLVLSADGGFTYTPEVDFDGADSFTYRAVDQWQESAVTTVNLIVGGWIGVYGTVTAQGSPDVTDVSTSVTYNIVPSSTNYIWPASDGSFTCELSPDTYDFNSEAQGYVSRAAGSFTLTTTAMSLGSTELRAGDSDRDGDVDAADGALLLTAFVAGLPNTGNRDDGSGNTVDLNGDGIVDAIDISLWASNYGLQGPMAWDTVPTTPPLAIADSYWVYQGVQLSVGGSGVLGNDFDQEGDSLTATIVDAPSNGSLTLNSDGSFTYNPDFGYTGPDSFTYLASDAQTMSVKTTVSIDVRASSGTTAGTTSGTTSGTTTGG